MKIPPWLEFTYDVIRLIIAFTSWRVLVGVAFVFAPLFLKMGLDAQHKQEARDWQSVPGIVESGEIRVLENRTGPSLEYAQGVVLTYRYTVGKSEYVGHEIRRGGVRFSSADEARQRLNRYLKQKNVTVYFDPDNPSRAVLERD